MFLSLGGFQPKHFDDQTVEGFGSVRAKWCAQGGHAQLSNKVKTLKMGVLLVATGFLTTSMGYVSFRN